MTGARSLALALVLAVLLSAWPTAAWAIPVFARKYGFDCTMCHVQFPKLNDFGQAYRDNGYRIMGKEAEERTVFETPTPIALRTSAGYNYDNIDDPGAEVNEDVRAFQVNGLDLLSAGVFSDRMAYFAIYVPEIKGSRSVVAQDGRFEMANVIYALRDAPTPLTVRVGRFEPASVAFSAKRTLTVAPYEIYDFGGTGDLAFADTQTGIEVAGVTREGVKLAAGWVDGSEAQPSGDSAADFYLRASKTFGRGQGQVVGHRLGGVLYSGKSRRADGVGGRESFHRLGADLSLNFGQTNVMAQYLRGSEDAGLNTFNPASDYDFTGGFVEVNHAFPSDTLGFARWGWVNTPSEQNQDRTAWTIGARYYPVMNVALHVEYFQRDIDRGAANGSSDFAERMFTTRVDFAF